MIGEVDRERLLPPTWTILSAARTGTAWLAVVSDDSGRTSIRRFSFDDEREAAPEALPVNGFNARTAQLHRQGRDVMLSEITYPFRSVVFSGEGPAEVLRPYDGESALATIPFERWKSWRALPLLRIADGYLQTLADPKSDWRLIVRSSSDAHARTARAVEVPLAFIDSDPSASEAFAIRRTDRQELVRYRWR